MLCKKCQPTYAEAKRAILDVLRNRGWKVSDNLKVPHATRQDGEVRFWFKPQAVWFSLDNAHTLGNARSTHSDIRTMTAEEWVRHTIKWLGLE